MQTPKTTTPELANRSSFSSLHPCSHLHRFCTVQDLIHGVERVGASDGVLLQVAEVNVRGQQDLERILLIPGRYSTLALLTLYPSACTLLFGEERHSQKHDV